MADGFVHYRDAQGSALALPWLDALYLRLVRARIDQTLAHGLLLSGPAGIGKWALAQALGDAWLCEGDVPPEARPCGACRGCGLTGVGNHPDLQRLVPGEGKSTISVDQVRELSTQLALKSHAGGSRVALIAPAELMTISAQNSLLKTLEEPPMQTVLVLIADRADALAPTIRSRCQQLVLSPPDPEQAQDWLVTHAKADPAIASQALQLARHAPLAALALVEDGFVEQATSLAEALGQIARGRAEPISVAGQWDKYDLGRIITWWQGAVHGLAVSSLVPSADTGQRALAASHRELAEQGAKWIGASDLFAFADRLAQVSLTLRGQANPRLLLEGLLIDWARVTRPARSRGKAR